MVCGTIFYSVNDQVDFKLFTSKIEYLHVVTVRLADKVFLFTQLKCQTI